MNKRNINTNDKSIYLAEISVHTNDFQRWILNFVDYHFKKMVKGLDNQKNEEVLQDISSRFWYFQINTKHNYIRALFNLKGMSRQYSFKGIFFTIIENATSRLIENIIKTRDKSMRYSSRTKDSALAIQFEEFEHFVVSESVKQ